MVGASLEFLVEQRVKGVHTSKQVVLFSTDHLVDGAVENLIMCPTTDVVLEEMSQQQCTAGRPG